MNKLRYAIARLAQIRLEDITLPKREEGQTLVEYALILSLIAVVAALILFTIGGQIKSIFINVSSSL